MSTGELTILVLLLVVAWIAWRMLRRSTPRRARATPVYGGNPRPSVSATVDTAQALAVLASCAHPEGAGDLTAVVQARVTDEAGGDCQFQFSKGSCSLVRGAAEHPALTISAAGQVWRDLAEKKVSFATAMLKGTLQAEGDTGLLMKLDAAFAGQPAEPVIARPTPAVSSPSNSESPAPVANSGVADSGQPIVHDQQALAAAIHAARENPNLSPAERRAAILSALQQNHGVGAEILASSEGVAGGTAFASASGSSRHAETREEVKRAIQVEMAKLPPNATHEQKMAAVRTALATVPDAAPYAAMLELYAGGSFKSIAGKVGGLMLEGVLDGLLNGN
jgi:hypothetical protein